MEEDHNSYAIIRHLRRCGHFLYFKTGGKTGRRQIFYILLQRGEVLQRELQDLLGVQSGSLSEIITIASLIEEETDGSDQANIASVIYNRIDNPSYETAGLLQIDASLLYALPDHEGAITNEDKTVDSPYNLYKNKGLPPTPISNPGLAAIDAALEPAETNYYYYALGTDGKHHFSTSLAEHNAFLASDQYAG